MSIPVKRKFQKKYGTITKNTFYTEYTNMSEGKCGALRHCGQCGSQFFQQDLPVYRDGVRAYIVCPYCRDHRIYIGTWEKKPVVKTFKPVPGKFGRNPDLLTVISF